MKATFPTLNRKLLSGIILALIAVLTSSQALARTSVPAEQAFSDAKKIAQRYNWEIYKGAGKSMDPAFSSTSFLLVKKIPFEAVKTGMTVLFHDADGDIVAHRVIGQTKDEIMTRGINNSKADPLPIKSSQVLGALVGTIDSNQALTEFDSIPTAIGKTYP